MKLNKVSSLKNVIKRLGMCNLYSFCSNCYFFKDECNECTITNSVSIFTSSHISPFVIKKMKAIKRLDTAQDMMEEIKKVNTLREILK